MSSPAQVHFACTVLAAGLWGVMLAGQAPGQPPELADMLDRVGARVEEWYGRAQSIVSTETVSIQDLRPDLFPQGSPRRLSFELRVAWDPGSVGPGSLPDASVLRQLASVNGRAPRPRDEPGCMDPKPVTPAPLTMLLASERAKFAFTAAGSRRVDGRPAVLLDYRGVEPEPADVTWTKDCVTISLPGRTRGRVWVDAETYDVIRLDEALMGQFEFSVPREHQRRGVATTMVVERAESSIRFRRVRFQDPDEALMLPASVDSLQIIRGAGVSRTRITQRFTDYRRFLTGGRIVE